MRSFLIQLLFAVSLCGQSTLSVPSTAFPTIQTALDAAQSGDRILVSPGTYLENLAWPMKDLQLIGAGSANTIIDGNLAGSCIVFLNGIGSPLIEGFTFRNGKSTGLTGFKGGGISFQGISVLTTSSAFSPIVRGCNFESNQSSSGGAIFASNTSLTVENSLFDSNIALSMFGSSGVLIEGGATVNVTHRLEFRGCEFRGHSGETVVQTSASTISPNIILNLCTFRNNSSLRLVDIFNNEFEMNGCRINNNQVAWQLIRCRQQQGATTFPRIESSFFLNNSCASIVGLTGQLSPLLRNLTVIRNTCTSSPFPATNVANTVENCLIRNNRNQANQTIFNPFGSPPVLIRNSNIQGLAGAGVGVVDVLPQFVDSMNGDFRYRPSSPMIDAGAAPGPTPQVPFDFRGRTRIQGTSVDIGAIESQSLAHHPAAAGTVGQGLGGPFEILKLNGSTGGVMREISATLGSSITMSVEQPGFVLNPLNFTVWAFWGVANYDTVQNVPAGVSNMMITPSVLLPFAQPSFFLLASSVGPIGPEVPLFLATPTPWISAPSAPLNFPFDLSIQGIIEESPGALRPTNAIVLSVN